MGGEMRNARQYGRVMDTYTEGQRVRFTANALGTIDPSVGLRFTEHVVGEGDTGTVTLEPGAMPDGWLAVAPDKWPDEYVPVDPRMIAPEAAV